MANNRMILVHTETGEELPIAKSFFNGWRSDEKTWEALQSFFDKMCKENSALGGNGMGEFHLAYENGPDVCDCCKGTGKKGGGNG